MKKKELLMLETLAEFNTLIAEKFAEWDNIYAHGNLAPGFMTDGFLLNNIRHDIVQLRERRDRLYEPKMVGQTDLFGGVVVAERVIPDILPIGYNAPETLARKKAFLQAKFVCE